MSWSRFHVKNVIQESSMMSKALINAKTAKSIIFVWETGLWRRQFVRVDRFKTKLNNIPAKTVLMVITVKKGLSTFVRKAKKLRP